MHVVGSRAGESGKTCGPEEARKGEAAEQLSAIGMGFAISSLRFAIGEAMAEEPAKNTQVKLEYETKDPTPWTYADDLGCAIVLIMFLVTAWVGIGFLLLAILEIF